MHMLVASPPIPEAYMLGSDEQDERHPRRLTPAIGSTRTRVRFAWFPTFTDDVESMFAIAWLCHVSVTERFSEPFGEEMFFPEPRWRTMHVVRAASAREVERRKPFAKEEVATTGN